jgi:D-alanyl-D-alanine carboxypeptidase
LESLDSAVAALLSVDWDLSRMKCFELAAACFSKAAPLVLTASRFASLVVLPSEARSRPQVGGYAPPTAQIVVDAKSGKVLFAENPDAPRHPASVTKVMTLYLLFEQLDRGKLTLQSELKVSPFAQRQAPSKLGVSAGDTITVEDAIKSIVTRSANDVAVVIAENIGGTESNFAQLMTRKARAIGMNHTVYRNASGLPDSGQITTARDLATLGRAIQSRFPKYYPYFAMRGFSYDGDYIGNHNKLLGRVEGVDGIKTGFTRMSGFNLLTSAKVDGRHIVAVVMGGRTGAQRDNQMARLVETYLPRATTGGSLPVIAEAERDNAPLTTGSVAEKEPSQKGQTASKTHTQTVKQVMPVAWKVLVGQAHSAKEAQALTQKAREKSKGVLAKASTSTTSQVVHHKTIFKAQFSGLSQQEAASACKHLKSTGLACQATRI